MSEDGIIAVLVYPSRDWKCPKCQDLIPNKFTWCRRCGPIDKKYWPKPKLAYIDIRDPQTKLDEFMEVEQKDLDSQTQTA